MGRTGLARVSLASLPTPLEMRPDLARELGIGSLAVKRDDLTSAVYGGNKVRKLEFLLGQAIAEGRTAVVTFGAYGSNHALATAVHARALGLEPHAVLSPQAPGPFARATLLAHAGLGTQLHPVESWEGEAEGARVAAMLAERDGVEPLVVPMGGTNARGIAGYVEAAFEVAEQVEAGLAPKPTIVYVAGGTLGTALGLAIGFAALGWPTRVTAVRVTPAEIANLQAARRLAGEAIELFARFDASFSGLRFEDLALVLREEWFEPGYGVVTPETLEAVRAGGRHGLKLETTYTGKAFAAMAADAAQGALRDESVLFVDTYSLAPPPDPGPKDALPPVLRAYVDECERQFGA
ncbi:MAG: pyridoxal-phosphate dependent enzyme [Coriobacteriia bacterium]|nr:pyridoxal-phosphate dependent enzyme [Coriobacteriia bacterium]